MQQKLVQNFFTTRNWSFWKQYREGTAKAMPKIEKYVYYIFTQNNCSVYKPMKVVVFCKHVLILQNNNSDFLTFIKDAKFEEFIL